MKNYKFIGIWWNSRDIEMVEVGGEVYALYGWNGEKYTDCWKCTGDHLMDASAKRFELRPIYEPINDDDFEIVDYEVFPS